MVANELLSYSLSNLFTTPIYSSYLIYVDCRASSCRPHMQLGRKNGGYGMAMKCAEVYEFRLS